MYPYITIFGTEISMTIIGVVIALIVFLCTSYNLTKKNHQDFLKLFYRLPWRIILSYLLWRYISFALKTWIYFPSSIDNLINIISPQNFNLHFVWILLSTRLCLVIFFSSIKRNENKKVRIDILFTSLANALIILWIFLTLWDSVIWIPTDNMFAIHALSDNSELTKFDWVYPVWLFISFWVLILHVIISILSIILKKNWLWIRWIIWILIILNIAFLFQSYPRYWLITIFGTAFDIKQYTSILVIIHCIITWIKREKKRF
jgi:hypothetical protein